MTALGGRERPERGARGERESAAVILSGEAAKDLVP